ncbi:MAG TPA: hypothetical protein PK177_07260 [Burkholderiaceae bacterium]|nr:hypothetical protein [Burkholderiaceae bacterium]
MALFRSNKPVVFDPYGSRRRSGFPVPRWLMLLVAGAALGAGGLYYIQQNHLPPRLTPAESQALLSRAGTLEAEVKRLQAALATTTADGKAALDGLAAQAKAAEISASRQIEAARAEIVALTQERDESKAAADSMRKDVALFERVLPPDPRGGTIGVRGARMSDGGGKLDYHVLLTRDAASKPFDGVMELVVAGRRSNGRNESVTLDPVAVSIGSYGHLQGSLPLPEGFAPRQVTIRVLDQPGGRQLGMRVFNVG